MLINVKWSGKDFLLRRQSNGFTIFLIAATLIALLATALTAQEKQKSDLFTLQLRSRTFTPQPGIDPEFRSQILRRLEQGLPTHAFAQLLKLPSPVEKRKLEKDGLKLLSSLGGNSYTATIRRREIIDPQLAPGLRWIGEILVIDKLQPEVQRGQFDEWARRPDGSVRLRVAFFEDVTTEGARAVIRKYAKADTSVGGGAWKVVVDTTQIRPFAGEDAIQYIEQEPKPEEPLNDVTRGMIKSETVQGINVTTTPPLYSGLTGAGVQIGIMDSGVDGTHDDFAGRIIRAIALAGSHGTHVAGTAAGSGELSDKNNGAGINNGGTPYQWRGHAPKAEIAAYPMSWLQATFTDAINNFGVDVTNHSHTQTPTPDYSANSQSVDQTIWDRNLYVSTAAGNNGDLRRNGSPLIGYFSLTGSKAKNPLTVGNYNSAQGIKDRSSSMGPTFDGRLKPDIVAPGTNIKSTVFNDAYDLKTGTSMASPAVTGTIALMLESYFSKVRPLNSTIKAVLIQTAVDLVQVPALVGEPNNADTGVPVVYHAGPDWATGYGLIDAAAATKMIATPNLCTEDKIDSTGENDFYEIFVCPGTSELKVTLAWDDYPGSIQTANTAPKLVNDLDLVLLSPIGAIQQPFVLAPLTPETPVGGVYTGVDPIAPGNIVPAAPGADHLNNVEQVRVVNPMPGIWRARVSGYAIPLPVQKYSLVSNLPFGQPKWKFEYAAKIVCGTQKNSKELRLARGVYATTINIHNPNDSTVCFFKKLALTYPPEEQRPGKIIPIAIDALSSDEALKVDCMEIRRKLFPNGFPTPYIEGFVIIQSPASLDVTAVYTAAKPRGFLSSAKVTSIDVEQIRERRKEGKRELPDLIPVPGQGGFFCNLRDGKLVVTVKNQGLGPSAPSMTEVEFSTLTGKVKISMPTPALAPGASTELLFDIPSGCFVPDCFFKITVDVDGVVPETNEGNNTAEDFCLG